jgi:DNA-binding response OmpR family regulator
MHTILLVDDDEDLVQALEFSLRQQNYGVVKAINGAEAVTKSFDLQPDLILLDIMMPNLDGLTACRAIKTMERTKDIPVVMLTAKGDIETIKAAFKVGADDYIVKPFGMDKVLKKIEEFLGTKVKEKSKSSS